MTAYQQIAPAYQVISSQPNRLVSQLDDTCNQIVTFPPVANKQAACMGIDLAQTATVGNFADAQKNLTLATASLLEATKADYSPLSLDPSKVDDDVRALRPKLWRLWQIRCKAKLWLRLLRSSQLNDPLVINAAAEAAELLREVMKPS